MVNNWKQKAQFRCFTGFWIRLCTKNKVFNPQFPADMVTFTERILNRKPYFLCSDASENMGCFLVRIFRHVNAQKWRFRLKGFLGFFYQIKPSRKTSFFYVMWRMWRKYTRIWSWRIWTRIWSFQPLHFLMQSISTSHLTSAFLSIIHNGH